MEKIKSFLVNADEKEMKKFKKRKDIEIVREYQTTECYVFLFTHIVYIEKSQVVRYVFKSHECKSK